MRILWMYPDILSLHGGRGDVMALQNMADKIGIKLEIERINHLNDEIDFSNADLLIFEPGELCVIPEIRNTLQKNREAFEEYISKGKGIFCVGTTGALFAKETLLFDGNVLEGLSVLNMTCVERTMPYGDDLIFYVSGIKKSIVGSQIQMIDTKLEEGLSPFGETVYGLGNEGSGIIPPNRAEGAVKNGVIFTNALGPVLVKNPWLTLWLLNKFAPIDEKTNKIEDDFTELWELEIKSQNAIVSFNKNKEKPNVPKA